MMLQMLQAVMGRSYLNLYSPKYSLQEQFGLHARNVENTEQLSAKPFIAVHCKRYVAS